MIARRMALWPMPATPNAKTRWRQNDEDDHDSAGRRSTFGCDAAKSAPAPSAVMIIFIVLSPSRLGVWRRGHWPQRHPSRDHKAGSRGRDVPRGTLRGVVTLTVKAARAPASRVA